MADLAREEIERLVRRVLAQLLAAPASSNVAAKETTSTTNKRTLQLDERVISLRSLEGRLEGIQQLLLPRGAIVTPAARDELKTRGIAWQTASSSGKAKEQSAANRIVVASSGVDATSLIGSLGDAVAVDQVSSAADLAATIGKWSDSVLGGKTPGVILADQPAAALVLANRNHGIRAILGSSPREASEAAAAIGANGLVVDPRGRGKFEVVAMIRAFAAAGWRAAPEALRKGLSGT